MRHSLFVVELFFGGIEVDGEAAYFTTSCNQVTGAVREQVATAFLEMLRAKGNNHA